MSDALQITRDGAVLRLVMNRPETLNALTPAMVDSLAHECEQAVTDDDIRVITITGAGGAFSAGAALEGEDPVAHFDVSSLDRANRLIRSVLRVDKPVVAGVEGVAAGVGCSLALACDLQLVSESASFLLAFSRIGLTCDGGTSATVAAAVGRPRAMRMALLAEALPGREAHDAGLVSHCVPQAAYAEELAALEQRLAAGPPLAFAATKRMVNAATLHRLEDALEAERSAQTALFSTADTREGMTAFAQRRRPVFEGR